MVRMMKTYNPTCIISSERGCILKISRVSDASFTKNTPFVWSNDRWYCAHNNMVGSGNTYQRNECVCLLAFEKQSNLSYFIRKYKSALPFYPRTPLCLIISCDKSVLKFNMVIFIWTHQSFYVFFPPSGVLEQIEIWKLMRDNGTKEERP